MFYTVYKITNIINGKIYIGVHKTINLNDNYMGSGKRLKYAQNKYGIENFYKEYISIFDNKEDMFKLESELVTEDFIKRHDTYNLKIGGFGGFDHINNVNGLNNKNHDSYNQGFNSGLIHSFRLKNDIDYLNSFLLRISKAHKEGKCGWPLFTGKSHRQESKNMIGMKNSIYQKGDKNSQFGTIWIYNLNLKKSIKINKESLFEYQSLGWIKGRKIKFI